MLSKPLWSVSVICKNEEDAIFSMTASLKKFIDLGGEIVVIDTGSTDKTINSLESLGFKKDENSQLRYEEVGDRFTFDVDSYLKEINTEFISPGDNPFEPTGKKVFDFGAARRYAGSRCKNDWVLSVDCDEVFSVLNIDILNAVIMSGNIHQMSFVFRYKDGNGNNNSVTSRDKFYNKNFGDWKWVVHEQVKALPDKELNMMHLPENVLSLDHYQHPAEHRNNYLISMCIDVMKDPNDQHVFWLGREFYFTGYHNSAISTLKKYLQKYPDAWSSERCMASLYIGDCYISLSKLSNISNEKAKEQETEALVWYFKSALCEKSFREPWIKLANYHYSKKEFSFTVQFLSAALKIKQVSSNYMNDTSCYGSDPHIKLYISLYANGEKEKSYKVWKKACSLFPKEKGIEDHRYLFTQISS